jgi:hypothetical protein
VLPLSAEGREEAVALLAQLLLDAVRKRGGVVSGVISGGALDGASGSVVSFPEKPGKARDAA